MGSRIVATLNYQLGSFSNNIQNLSKAMLGFSFFCAMLQDDEADGSDSEIGYLILEPIFKNKPQKKKHFMLAYSYVCFKLHFIHTTL